jgi:hypothetical protein
MPHSNDIGVDLDNYLTALNKYNLAYGPRPQNAGGTGGQNFQTISIGEAPGYAYVNPETNEPFPLYPPEEASTNPQDQFHDYLGGLGATRKSVGYGNLTQMARDPYGFGVSGGRTSSGQHTFKGPQGNLYYNENQGHNVPGLAKAPYKYLQHPETNAAGANEWYGGWQSSPAYFDDRDRFLGYGSSSDELFANASPLLRRDYYQSLYGQQASPEGEV